MKIKGLTLIRPWGYAVIQLGKDIENRSWYPSTKTLEPGDWIAIHNGVKWEQEEVFWIEDMFKVKIPHRDSHPTGAIIGVARYMGWTDKSNSRWFFGEYGWKLQDAFVIEPIPHKGALGLWALEPAALAQAEKAIEQAAK